MTKPLEALIAEMKAAAANATQGEWCTDSQHGICADAGLNGNFYIATCSGPEYRHNANFIAKVSPANVMALIAALEKAQQDISELRDGFIANQEEACEAIKYATELKEQLSRAIKCRDEAINEMDGMQKSLDHTHQRRALWRAKAESAEKRIAELEASQLSVNLPEKVPVYADDGLQQMLINNTHNAAIDACAEAIRAAGGTVGGE